MHGHLLFRTLAVSDVGKRTDEACWLSIGIDDESTQDQPTGGIDGLARADFEFEATPLSRKAAGKVFSERCNILRMDGVEHSGDRVSPRALFHADDLVQARGKVGAIRHNVPPHKPTSAPRAAKA